MSQNKEVIYLVTTAGLKVGSQYKLAKIMELPQSVLTDWKAGRRLCTPLDRARLALFAEQDAAREYITATIEHTAGTKRGDQLAAALKKFLGQVWPPQEPQPLQRELM